jgi:hypothetical protein
MRYTLIVGDELDQTTEVPAYPASDGWTLYYRLIPRTSGTPILLTGSASGDSHRHQVASAVTATWAAGEYSCFAWVENVGGTKHTVDPETGAPGDTSLVVTLRGNPRTMATYDGRSPARVALDAINTALATHGAQAHILEYTIGNRSMRFKDQADLLTMRSSLAAEVWREDAGAKMAAGLPNPRFIQVRLGRV